MSCVLHGEGGNPAVLWRLAGFGVLRTLFYGLVLAAVQDMTPARIRSTAIAVLIFAQDFLGVGPGQWMAGRIGDRADLPEPLTHGLIVVALAAYLAVPLFVAAAWRRNRERQ
ncbi:MAG: hypothetical protein NTW86_04370 [Candidatus Sumerlaeota bacterium]|nr:hypothetical protein [Candidatus Sumerlaeota bacterium]